MKKKKVVLIFTGMISEKFGAIERYNVEIARQLSATDLRPVFVYNQMPPNKNYLGLLYDFGAEVIELRIDEGYWTMVKNINRLLNSCNPKVVHTNFYFPQVRAAIFLAWLKSVPVRLCTIGSMPGNNPKFVSRMWYRTLAFMSTKILTVSDAIRNALIEKFSLKPKDVETLRRGINLSIFEEITEDKQDIREKYNLPQDKTIIGCVAFHQPIKGVDVLLEAMALLKHKYKRTDILLCQIGGWYGNTSSELQLKAKELKMDDMIFWMGLQDNVPELLRAFDIYCQPSRSEGLPSTILEAFAVGLPVVATKVGGIPEIIKNMETGLLVESENYKEIAEKINILIENQSLAKTISDNASKILHKEFYNCNNVSKLISSFYKID